MDGWIVVPNWDKFQHYKDRDPLWIKQYNELVHRDDYLELPPTSRALLHGIWSLYAVSNGVVRCDKVPFQLRLRVEKSHWESLNHAGFIQIVASKPLALTRSREKRREEKKKDPASSDRPTPKSTGTVSRPNADAYKPAERPDDHGVLPPAMVVDLMKDWLDA